ncbi:DoxX family protein [Hymenobacter terrenus]|uniref:DoxX family protein n=1 Tax=Hymenobacter terrenus TaxID=1629124 RepID=UPI0018CE4AA4|nr:DoxX family protein [Hymenobacter terrenus]
MSNQSKTKLLYGISISLFSAIFVFSALLTIIDVQGSYAEFQRLSFPTWLTYPTGIAKLLGVLAILKSKSRSLKDLAFAGFLYDLLLALGAHIAVWDILVLGPVISLVVWAFAFITDRQYYESRVTVLQE